MPSALIGHTGFVGSNLVARHRFDACFNSKNIEAIIGGRFDLIVCSGLPAAKWVANREPDADRAGLDRLVAALRQVTASHVVVISTVDVYPVPVGVDEDAPIDLAAQQPYGRHRLMLEQSLADHFPDVLVVRLPGLFGPGLKKNAIYDLLHGHETHKIHAGGVFQFYNVARLWDDLSTARRLGLRRVNFTTEPVRMDEVARVAFGIEFANDPGSPPARYDARSRHAAAFGGRDGYLYDRPQVLAELREFVDHEREGAST